MGLLRATFCLYTAENLQLFINEILQKTQTIKDAGIAESIFSLSILGLDAPCLLCVNDYLQSDQYHFKVYPCTWHTSFTRTCRDLTRTCHDLTRTCHNLTRTCHNLTRTYHDFTQACHNLTRTCHNLTQIFTRSWWRKCRYGQLKRLKIFLVKCEPSRCHVSFDS